MNSGISGVTGLQADETEGATAIYGGAAASAPAPATTDTLPSGSRLLPGQSLTSANRRFRLVYERDGNVVLYDDVERTMPWSSSTAGLTTGQGGMETHGHFVVFYGSEHPRRVGGRPSYPK